MSAFKRLYLAIAFLMISVPALADETKASDMDQGVLAYRQRDYKTALKHFEAAVPNDFSNPILHYYLGNCMVFLNYKETAIKEYRIGYALDPGGNAGTYCKQCLVNLKADVTDASSAKKGMVSAADHQKVLDELKTAKDALKGGPLPPPGAISSEYPGLPPGAKLLEVRMNRFNLPPKPSPDAATIIKTFSAGEKANFEPAAYDRLQRAQRASTDAERVYQRAQEMLSGEVPKARAYGETEEQYQKRKTEQQAIVNASLDGFRKDAMSAKETFMEEQGLYQMCVFEASRGGSGRGRW